MLQQHEQHLLAGLPRAHVAEQHGRQVGDVQGPPDVRHVVGLHAVEAVDADDERDAVALEEVDRGETAVEPAGVGEDDRAQRPGGELVPDEPEPLLPGGAEQVEDHLRVDRDPAEVHRDRGRLLGLDQREVVDAVGELAQQLLGAQRGDLAHRAHQRRLAHPETARDQQLHRRVRPLQLGGVDLGVEPGGNFRACVRHRSPSESARGRQRGLRCAAGS